MNWKEKLDECTHSGKYHWITCWGVAHVLGMLALLAGAWLIDEAAVMPAAVVGSIITIIHELNGPGDLLNSTDRILDWVLPIIVAIAFVVAV